MSYMLALLGILPLFAFVTGSPLQRAILSDLDKLKADLDYYPHKDRVTFRPDGTLKLTVFSDLHYGENPWDWWGPEQDKNSTRLMRRVLAEEKPDFVVLNGDLITGENTFSENSTSLIDEIVRPLNEAKVPFASSYGNHDNQVNITHKEEILREQKVAPLSYTRLSPPGVGGQGGEGNYWVPIYHRKTDFAPALILWFFDSRGGVSPGENSTQLPDWVDASVADWIETETKKMNALWGAPTATKRGALAFVHIPPHIVSGLQEELDSEKEPGLNGKAHVGPGSVQGTFEDGHEGNDTKFWDALNKNIENLHAVISGHDHGNEWCIRDTQKNVIFCFDKHSGYGGYSSDGWGYGVRNILFKSPDPSIGAETWIRLEEGETRAKIVLDKNYN